MISICNQDQQCYNQHFQCSAIPMTSNEHDHQCYDQQCRRSALIISAMLMFCRPPAVPLRYSPLVHSPADAASRNKRSRTSPAQISEFTWPPSCYSTDLPQSGSSAAQISEDTVFQIDLDTKILLPPIKISHGKQNIFCPRTVNPKFLLHFTARLCVQMAPLKHLKSKVSTRIHHLLVFKAFSPNILLRLYLSQIQIPLEPRRELNCYKSARLFEQRYTAVRTISIRSGTARLVDRASNYQRLLQKLMIFPPEEFWKYFLMEFLWSD